MTIRVIVADDEALIRGGIAMLLSVDKDIEVVAEVGDGRAAVDAVGQLRPDVAILDVRMPIMDGVTATRLITNMGTNGTGEDLPPVAVLVLSTFNIDQAVFAALRAGASGFLLKDAAPVDLVAATRAVAGGDAWLDPAVAKTLITEFAARPDSALPPMEDLKLLTPREREVLILMAYGLNNSEIAGRLVVGEGTVKTHVSRILMKLGLRDRTQAVVMAYRSHLMDPDPTLPPYPR
jgi:DNA-binding NarL/FixJ family response regulator